MRVCLAWHSIFDPKSEDLNKNKPKSRTNHRRGSSMKESEILTQFQTELRKRHGPYSNAHTSKYIEPVSDRVNCATNFYDYIHIHSWVLKWELGAQQECLVSKLLVMKVWAMEFGLPNTHKDMVMCTYNPELQRGGHRDNQILEAYWSTNLDESVSLQVIQWDTSSQKDKGRKWPKKDTWCWLRTTYVYPCTHVHILTP